ncbi:MAG TPA: ABC transporter permease [Bryobacteraceae bacterium]
MKPRRWRDVLRMRARSIFRANRMDEELAKELDFHLDRAIAEARAQGSSPETARLAALKRLGGMTHVQEECRDMRRTNFLENARQDTRYAARMLAKSPGFTAVIVLTMALSIGATSAIVSVVEGVLLRSLPYRAPDRLVRIFTTNEEFPKFPINRNDFLDFRSRLHSFESIAAYVHNDMQLSGSGEAVRLSGFSVTASFFRVLGLKPAIGREFDHSDELPGRGHVAIISDTIWRTRLGARRDVLVRKVILNAVPYTVVGVMPPGVQHPGNMYHAVAYGDTVDLWTPFTFTNPQDRGSHFLDAVARLRPGVTAAQAQSEMNAAMKQLAREHPDGDSGWNVLVIPLDKEIVGRSERMLLVLLGAVVLVLLLACVNAANLLLARATARQREIAVRAAVGAGRWRLIRQMLTESVLLALAGAVIGAGLAVAGVKILVALLPADFPRAGDIRVDVPLFLFALVIALGTGIAFGTVPAWQGSRADLRDALHESGRSATGSRATLRLRNGLVMSEVTLACVLLIGAGLMLRSFVNLLKTNPGFRPEQVLTASISLPDASYKDNNAIAAFYQRLLPEIRNIPGVSAAGAGSDLPWTGWDDNAGGFQIQGETPPPRESFHARFHMATPGYFRALGMAVIRGRAFDEHDKTDSRGVLIINEAMAHFWRHGDALGGKLTYADHPKDKDWLTIVGIVADVKDTPKDAGAQPAFWWPMLQEPFPLAANSSVAIRSNLDPKLLAGRLRSAVRAQDGNLAVSDVRTMEQVAAGSYATARFALFLVALFAALALSLAAIGTYGVIAYSVSQRIHEFGVRMALGAGPWRVMRSVLANGMKLAIAGTVLGIVLGLTLSRLLGNLLYEVSALDPVAIVATCAIAIAVAAVACYVPAIRATRADPVNALRAE